MKKHVFFAANADNGALDSITVTFGDGFDFGAIFDKIREIFQKIVDFFRNLFNANK